jgi:hypothetical protein
VNGKTITETFSTTEAWARHGTRLPSAAASENWAKNGWTSRLNVNQKICGPQWPRPLHRPGKKAAEAFQKEVAREVDRLAGIIFRDRGTGGQFYLESVESVIRSATHRAGASPLTKLLQFEAPDAGHPEVLCPSGHTARFKDMRTKAFFQLSERPRSGAPITCVRIAPEDGIPRMSNWASPGNLHLVSGACVRGMCQAHGGDAGRRDAFAPAREPIKLLARPEVRQSRRTGG